MRLLCVSRKSISMISTSSGKLPTDITVNSTKTYKEQGWKGYSEWLENFAFTPLLGKFRNFSGARKFVHSPLCQASCHPH